MNYIPSGGATKIGDEVYATPYLWVNNGKAKGYLALPLPFDYYSLRESYNAVWLTLN